jgi:hypothetical protein
MEEEMIILTIDIYFSQRYVNIINIRNSYLVPSKKDESASSEGLPRFHYHYHRQESVEFGSAAAVQPWLATQLGSNSH